MIKRDDTPDGNLNRQTHNFCNDVSIFAPCKIENNDFLTFRRLRWYVNSNEDKTIQKQSIFLIVTPSQTTFRFQESNVTCKSDVILTG